MTSSSSSSSSSSLVCVATCNLNQWALDFDGNVERIERSIREAKQRGARYRLGPELEISGYTAEDHYFEADTLHHSWESIVKLLQSDVTDDILVDVGTFVLHRGVRYNCRIFLLNRKIVCIRPKVFLANEANYRELRWFSSWPTTTNSAGTFLHDEHELPLIVQRATGQTSVPIGVFLLQLTDASIGSEVCEELFAPDSMHIRLSLQGCDIISNGSGSHHSLRKLNQRMSLMENATGKCGGAYLYANQSGCDGGRLYFDGSACVFVNGSLVEQSEQFSVQDVEVITAWIDVDEVRSYRASISSRNIQGAASRAYAPLDVLRVDFELARSLARRWDTMASMPRPVKYLTPEEEIAFGPACWLWDYMRRSGAIGFFLPLSGGADSSATLAIVASMCRIVHRACLAGNQQVLLDVHRVLGVTLPSTASSSSSSSTAPTRLSVATLPAEFSPAFLAKNILHTAYLSTTNSSEETRNRARTLSEQAGAYFVSISIDSAMQAVLNTFETVFGRRPTFKVHGGTVAENLALQNLQARLRMVFSYMCASLLPWYRSRAGYLLVLASANVDEALRGYMTKYDCSSGDINPIGGISKEDLRKFLVWAAHALDLPVLADVERAKPTAELEPITDTYVQNDEDDMGMSYAELSVFGRLRKIGRAGPLAMYNKLKVVWSQTRALPLATIAQKVKSFFYYYSINRHKMTVLTPSYHCESYSPEDNRFDLRPFLYNAKWTRAFAAIDQQMERDAEEQQKQQKQQHDAQDRV